MKNLALICALVAAVAAPALADPVTAGTLNVAASALPAQGFLPQGIPSVATAPTGETLIIWVEEILATRSLRALFLDASGATVSGPTSLALGQLNPINIECAATPTGFMAVFDADTPTTVGLRDVHYRTFDLTGTQTSSGQANILTNLDEARPQVDGNASGNYAIVWNRRQSFFATPSAGVYIRRFSNTGIALDPGEIRVDDPVTMFFSGQDGANVGLFNNGRAIVAWHDGVANAGPSTPSPDGHGWGILYRVLDSNMSPVIPPTVANTTTADDQFEPLIATGDRDTATIAWCGDIQPLQVDAWCSRFDDQGAALDANDLNLTPTNFLSSQFVMGVAMSSNGEIMATWQDGTSTTGQPGPRCGWARLDSSRNVFDQGVTESGGPASEVHTFPRVGSDQFGNFVVAWRSDNASGNPIDVRYRRYARNMIQLTTTTPTVPGFLTVTLDSPSDANNVYLLGASGGPGPFPLDTRSVGLTMDPLLDYVLTSGLGGVGPIFYNFGGVLDGMGRSSLPGIVIPNVPSLSGTTVYFVFATGQSGAPNGINTISHQVSATAL